MPPKRSTRTEPSGDAERAGGFALLVVLWFLVLLAAIGSYMLAGARSQTALAHNLLAGARAEALADAAVARAAFNQGDPDPRNRWSLDGRPNAIAMQGGAATIRLHDESLKINPNKASAAMMSGLFQALGFERAKSDTLGAAISDWVRPPDQDPNAPGQAGQGQAAQAAAGPSAADPYEAAGRPYRTAHAPIESLDELLLVTGITPDILARARPHLTIFTDQDGPRDAKLALASPIVAKAVAMAGTQGGPSSPATTAPADSQFQSDGINDDANPPRPPNTAAQPGGQDDIVMSIDVAAQSGDGGVFVRHAVLRLGGSAGAKPYAVLDWRRGDAAP